MAAGRPRWTVRRNALGRWQTKTFCRRQDAGAFRRKVDADERRGMAVDVGRSLRKFEEFATEWRVTRRRLDGRALTPRVKASYGDLLERIDSQPGPEGYVFTGPTGGPVAPVHRYGTLAQARRRPGSRSCTHHLRHAVGTFFVQQGATTKEIMARLGHRSRAAADRYQHAASRCDAELAAKTQHAVEKAQARRGSRSHR
jgi:integrase